MTEDRAAVVSLNGIGEESLGVKYLLANSQTLLLPREISDFERLTLTPKELKISRYFEATAESLITISSPEWHS